MPSTVRRPQAKVTGKAGGGKEPEILARKTAQRLRRDLGRPEPPPKRPPLDELVNTILSQNTNDRNRDRAFAALKRRFPIWSEVLAASEEELAGVIRPAGLAPTKAKRIRGLLSELQGRGERLEDICRLPMEEALARLTAIKGVGPKTAACVLLFSCGVPAFPVDTHVFRVTKRLGLLPQEADRVKAHRILAGLFRPRQYLDVHLNLVALGRTVCRPVRPLCPRCPLAGICRDGKGAAGWIDARPEQRKKTRPACR